MSLFIVFLDAHHLMHTIQAILCVICTFKEGPSKVILEAELLDLRQQVKARRTSRSLEFEICLRKKGLFKGCAG